MHEKVSKMGMRCYFKKSLWRHHVEIMLNIFIPFKHTCCSMNRTISKFPRTSWYFWAKMMPYCPLSFSLETCNFLQISDTTWDICLIFPNVQFMKTHLYNISAFQTSVLHGICPKNHVICIKFTGAYSTLYLWKKIMLGDQSKRNILT